MNNDNIDQEYPLEVDDEYITSAGILPMPAGRISSMTGANAQSRLVDVLASVVKHIYPVKQATHVAKPDHTYVVSYSKLQELEGNLRDWMTSLPFSLHSCDEDPPRLAR